MNKQITADNDTRYVPINCHFVPQFILNHYGQNLTCYNVKTCEIIENRNPESIFSKGDLYSYTLEKKFNERMESNFAQLLKKKIINQEKIILQRNELFTVKRFLMTSMLRTPDNLATIHNARTRMRDKAKTQRKMVEILMRRFINEVDSDETDEEYWKRTLDCILEDRLCTPESIEKNPNATYFAYHFASVMYSGYLTFWDAPIDTDEFIVTDIGMTSENEIGWNEFSPNKKKFDAIMAWIELIGDKDPTGKLQLQCLLASQMRFHENFMMFPLSSKRMAVLINPFFKHYNMLNDLRIPVPDISIYTLMGDLGVFKSNISGSNFCSSDEERRINDKYTYEPIRLSKDDCRYCNALIMDRIDQWVGFSSFDKIKGSVLTYDMMNKSGAPRNNYLPLLNRIMEEDQKKR